MEPLLNGPTSFTDYTGVDMGESKLALPQRITCFREEGRVWFARGWFHTLNYNHEEAVWCFTRCAQIDPHCLMGYWGIGEIYCIVSS